MRRRDVGAEPASFGYELLYPGFSRPELRNGELTKLRPLPPVQVVARLYTRDGDVAVEPVGHLLAGNQEDVLAGILPQFPVLFGDVVGQRNEIQPDLAPWRPSTRA